MSAPRVIERPSALRTTPVEVTDARPIARSIASPSLVGWVAVGDPAQILPPGEHERIWEIQKPLNFPLTVYGFERHEASMEKITRRLSEALASHAGDLVDD